MYESGTSGFDGEGVTQADTNWPIRDQGEGLRSEEAVVVFDCCGGVRDVSSSLENVVEIDD